MYTIEPSIENKTKVNDNFAEYNLILEWLQTFKNQGILNAEEYSRAIEITNKLYSDVRE